MERYKYYKIDDSQTSVLPLCTNINTYLYSWIDGISKEGRKERIRIAARKEKNRDWTLSKQDCRGTRFVFSKLCIIIQERRRFEMASEHGEEIIRNVASRVQEEERSAIVQGRSVQRVFFYYTAPLSQTPALLLLEITHSTAIFTSHRLGTTRKESIIARIIAILSNQSSKVISSKNSKNSGDFKIGRRLGIEKCWYKLFLFEEGCPLESARSFFQAGEPGPPEDGPRSIRGGGCCERGGRKRNGSCPVSRIAEWRVRATRLEVIRAICRRSSQVDRGRPGRDPALTSIRRPVARAHLTRINLETESRPRFTVQVQVQGSWNLHAPGLPSSLTLRHALSPTDFWSKAAEVARNCYSCLEG